MLIKGRPLGGIVMGMMLSSLLAAGQGLSAENKPPEPKAPAAKPSTAAKLSAEQIVEKHVAARGGAQAWKAVQTLQLSGKLEAGHGDSYARSMGYVHSNNSAGKGAHPTPAARNVKSPGE